MSYNTPKTACGSDKQVVYNVYNDEFRQIGTVIAASSEAAFNIAKKKWPYTFGLMVEPADSAA